MPSNLKFGKNMCFAVINKALKPLVIWKNLKMFTSSQNTGHVIVTPTFYVESNSFTIWEKIRLWTKNWKIFSSIFLSFLHLRNADNNFFVTFQGIVSRWLIKRQGSTWPPLYRIGLRAISLGLAPFAPKTLHTHNIAYYCCLIR